MKPICENLRLCGPIDQDNVLVQYFRPPVGYLSGVTLRFGTYRNITARHLRFRVDLVDDTLIGCAAPATGSAYFDAEVSAEGISDGGYFHLYFPTISSSKGRLLELVISSPDESGNAVTTWLSCGEDRIPGHVLCRTGQGTEESFGLQASLITSSPTVDTSYPEGLLYSPYSSCNMNCTHCISRHSRQRKLRMPQRAKQDINDHADAKRLRWMFTDYSGDIFFAERTNPGELDFILSLGIAIHIDTNGAYIDSTMIDRIMMSHVDAVSISVDAAQDETYKAIRIGGPPINRIFDTARALVAARTQHGREGNFRISMGFTLMRSNLHELPLFIQKAAKAGVDVVGCRHLEVYHADMESESLLHHKEYFNSMRAACKALASSLGIELLIGEELGEHKREGGNNPCLIPWKSAVVLANGDVMACCVPGSKMGNVEEQPLEAIWQGEAYRRLRARVNSAEPPTLCKVCQFRGPIDRFETADAICAIRTASPLLEDLLAD